FFGDADRGSDLRFEIAEGTCIELLRYNRFDSGLFETIFKQAGLRNIVERLEDHQGLGGIGQYGIGWRLRTRKSCAALLANSRSIWIRVPAVRTFFHGSLYNRDLFDQALDMHALGSSVWVAYKYCAAVGINQRTVDGKIVSQGALGQYFRVVILSFTNELPRLGNEVRRFIFSLGH